MKSVTKESRNGLKFTVACPETVDEFDQLAKRTGACLDEASDNVWYRGVFPQVWDGLAYLLSVAHGKAITMKPHPEGKKSEKGEALMVRAESNPQFVDRVAAELSVDVLTFQPLVDKLCNEGWDETDAKGNVEHFDVEFDPSARERTAKVPKPGKQDSEDAAKFIAQGPAGLAITLGKISQVTGKQIVVDRIEGDALVQLVALAVRDYRHTIAKTASAGLSA